MSAIQLDATATVTKETVTVNDMILRLDALAEGYEEVLKQAKQQLMNFEIKDSDWTRLARKLEATLSYRTLSANLATALHDGLRAIEAREASTWDGSNAHELNIATAVIERLEVVLRKRVIDECLQAEIKRHVEEAFKDAKINVVELAESAADMKFQNLQREALDSAYQKEHLIKDLLHSVFHKELPRVAAEAMESYFDVDVRQAVREVLAERDQQQQGDQAVTD